MSRSRTQYSCTNCGSAQSKWVGRCPDCGDYNTMVEEQIAGGKGGAKPAMPLMGAGPKTVIRSETQLRPQGLNARTSPPPRTSTGYSELDRALGGGLVEASVTLIGGDPGIGKSTLLLQAAAAMAPVCRVAYISGEESLDQIQLRAERLGVENAPVDLIPSNDCLAIADYIETMPQGSLAIIDSIQVMNAGLDGAPGSPSQVKTCAAHLIPAAKTAGVSLIVVSHVTKDGSLAGPNLLKHSVDTTVYIETDAASGLYRLVRAEKNRFGSTGEVGVFEMSEQGMRDVVNPSEAFIAQRDATAFGTVIYPSIEGSRPLLLEVQALVAPTVFGTGRRQANGWEGSRLNMLLATLSARLGISLVESDIYVNVAGGLKIADPAMDLAVAMAILSARLQVPLPANTAAFGEIGLAGEVRRSAHAESRIREATQLGMTEIFCPALRDSTAVPAGTACAELQRLAQALTAVPAFADAFGNAA